MTRVGSLSVTFIVIVVSIPIHLALSFSYPSAFLHVAKSCHTAIPLSIVGDTPTHEDDSLLSRRRLITRVISNISASSFLINCPSLSVAKVVSNPSLTDLSRATASPERDALLQALANQSSDEIILQAINNLISLNVHKLKNDAAAAIAVAKALDGKWKLLWYNKSDFSPFLKLPYPLRPDSYQYFGSVAEKEVGVGRVAQGLTGGILSALGPNKQLWLSSGAVSNKDNPSILEIYPPFRLQLGEVTNPSGLSTPKQTIVESQSDADFRARNGRTTEAQLAPKNEYEQLYLENFGRGSLRISTVVRGDPVIVGEMFIHQKL